MHRQYNMDSVHIHRSIQLHEMGPDSNLRVLDAGVVRPSNLHLPPHSLPLTFFDVKWLRPPPVQRLYLYRLHHHQDAMHLISDLKASLSKALTLFYPLTGHVRLIPGAPSSNRYELFYQPGDGVSFTVTEYDTDINELAQDDPVQVAKLAPIVPPLPKGRAVLAVQATVLSGGQGLALGVTVHHTACDGASSTHFMDTWAAACGGADMPSPPVIDRTLIADPRGLYDIYCKGLPSDGSEIEFVSSSVSDIPGDQLLATFTLPPEVLRRIKDMLTGEAARKGATSPRSSSLLAAFSFKWPCYCRAKQEQNQTKTTYFLFSVDHRTRLKPPVPDGYLGNCLGPAIAAASHDEIAAIRKEGLFAAFMALSDALQDEVGEGSQDRWDGCVERVKEAVKSGVLSVADSPRFRVYNLDFGFGKPAKVDVVSVAKTSAISVEEARSQGGGIEVGISLPTSSMKSFQQCFAHAMQERGYT